MRVLVVEDHEDSLAGLVEFLRICGHDVTGMPDAESGLAAHETEPFKIVLTDINLPLMDGFGLARALRALAGPPPYIFGMSGVHPSQENRRLFDLFFAKPMNLNELACVMAEG